jgi:predicted nucleotidyltransferase
MSTDSLAAIRPLWSRFQVKNAWVFGSRARSGGEAGSDWDFLVEFDDKPGFSTFMGLKCALEDTLRAKVDLLSLSAVKRSFLQRIEKDLVDVSWLSSEKIAQRLA